MTQFTATVARQPVLHRRTATTVRRYLTIAAGSLILAGVAFWLVSAFIKHPALFATSAIVGLQNGTLYALIALGYTLVYGIIELINFAHGDLFMMGTLFAGFMITSIFGINTSGGTLFGWIVFVLALVACMAFCATINVSIEFFAYRQLG